MSRDQVYFAHVIDAIDRIADSDYVSAGRDSFLADRKTQDAVVRNIEIIGEAVKNLSEFVRTSHPEVPWREVAGMRDKLIHEYFGIDLDLVWDVVARELPRLRSQVERIDSGSNA